MSDTERLSALASPAGPRPDSLLGRYGLPPSEIEARSLALVEQLAAPALPADRPARRVAVMMLYAAGDPALAASIRIQAGAVEAGLRALRSGCSLVADVRMVAAAIERERLARTGVRVVCAIDHPLAAELARRDGITRAAAAMQLLGPALDGAVVVVGNAPTALLALLDAIDAGQARPALIIGTPVGLVAASESKDELTRRSVPYITVLGTRGGSAMAVAALNALLRMLEET